MPSLRRRGRPSAQQQDGGEPANQPGGNAEKINHAAPPFLLFVFVPLPVLERVKALVRLFCGRFNGGQARNDFNVRFALFLLLCLDFVRVGLDVADFGKNGRVALRFVATSFFPFRAKAT